VDARVAELRRALDDDPEHPRFIETVVGQGYRFIAPVKAA
jgi:two-component system alkaline phosphatase synthesis response regulator PhoP